MLAALTSRAGPRTVTSLPTLVDSMKKLNEGPGLNLIDIIDVRDKLGGALRATLKIGKARVRDVT